MVILKTMHAIERWLAETENEQPWHGIAGVSSGHDGNAEHAAEPNSGSHWSVQVQDGSAGCV